MDANSGFLLLQVFNLILLIGWLALGLIALFGLRNRALPPLVQVIWVLIILVVPLVGAIAFWVIKPGDK